MTEMSTADAVEYLEAFHVMLASDDCNVSMHYDLDGPVVTVWIDSTPIMATLLPAAP